jgi:hypothetical protein
MSQTTLFMFGAGVSVIVFAGVFSYLLMSFGRWSDRSTLESDAQTARMEAERESG